MKKLTAILSFAFILGLSLSAIAKPIPNNSNNKTAKHNITVSIPSHALVGLSSTSGITLEPAAPTTAGNGLDFSASSASDNSLWLNYSSIIKGFKSNTISVNMTGDNLPNGVTIKVQAGKDSGKGKGKTGNSKSEALELSTVSKTFISDIGNCYTGTGSNAGHQLTYSLELDKNASYKELTSGDFSTTVVYTITEN